MDDLRAAIKRIAADDPSLSSYEAYAGTWAMNPAEFLNSLVQALPANTNLKQLKLIGCALNNADAAALGTALSANNGLTLLDLSKNRIGADGAIALAAGLKTNAALKELVLLENQRFGEGCVAAFQDMLEDNVTLTKITWRLECRSSTKLNSMLTRNKEIERRMKAGKPFEDIDPRVRRTVPASSADA